MDTECAVCSSIKEAMDHLKMICQHIDFSCQGKQKKSDFGLDKSFIERQVATIKQMQEWHNFYHATGKSLKDSRNDVNYPQQGRVFRRFRPG
jgi:hypothetical protein